MSFIERFKKKEPEPEPEPRVGHVDNVGNVYFERIRTLGNLGSLSLNTMRDGDWYARLELANNKRSYAREGRIEVNLRTSLFHKSPEAAIDELWAQVQAIGGQSIVGRLTS